MAGITPTSGVGGIQFSPEFQNISKPTASSEGQFGKVLENVAGGANADQQKSVSAVQDLLSGRNDNVLPVIHSVAKADMSFKLLMGVRNKMIEAYKTTMNMQI